MDKETLSHYGWIVVLILILSVMIALATPLGQFIADGFKATYIGFGNVSDNALGIIGQFPGGGGGNGTEPESTGIKFYQPYRGKLYSSSADIVFHEDGAVDFYMEMSATYATGHIQPPGSVAYEDDNKKIVDINDVDINLTSNDDGTILTGTIYGQSVTLTLIPTPIQPLQFGANYLNGWEMNPGQYVEYSVIFREDGSATYKCQDSGQDPVVVEEYPAGTNTFYDKYFEEKWYDNMADEFVTERYGIYPNGSRVIWGNVYRIDCNHPNTETRNATATYSGDIHCTYCGRLLDKGENYFGLFEDGALEIFETQGIQAVQNMKITSWDELLNNHTVALNNGVLSTVFAGANVNTTVGKDNANSSLLAGDLILPHDGSILTIDSLAFTNCKELTGIYIPNSITTIGEYAFYCKNYASNLTTVLFQKDSNLTEINHNAFCDCTKLESIYIPNGVTTLGHGSFRGSGISSVTFEENSTLDYIQYEAFCGCFNLTYIKIPASVRYMEDYDTTGVFTSSGLKTVEFEENSKLEYFARAFQNCASLETVNFGNNPNIKNISGMAFANNTKLTTVILPENIESLGQWAFSDSTSLTTIYLPSTVTSLGKSSLLHTNLTTIYFGGTMEQWNNISKTYASIPSGCTITCSDGTITI